MPVVAFDFRQKGGDFRVETTIASYKHRIGNIPRVNTFWKGNQLV